MDVGRCLTDPGAIPYRLFSFALLPTTAQMDLAFWLCRAAIRAEFALSLSRSWRLSLWRFCWAAHYSLLGWLADRIGRLPLFQFSLLGSSVLVALISVAPGVLTLTVLRGASIAVVGSVPDYRGDSYRGNARPYAWTRHGSPANFIHWVKCWLPLVNVAVDRCGWRQLFWVAWWCRWFGWRRRPVNRLDQSQTRAQEALPTSLSYSQAHPGACSRFFSPSFLWAYAALILFPSFLREVRHWMLSISSLLIGAGNAVGIFKGAGGRIGERVWTRRTPWCLDTAGLVAFSGVGLVPETFSHILLTYALMSMFFYLGGGEVCLSGWSSTRIRTPLACCGSWHHPVGPGPTRCLGP